MIPFLLMEVFSPEALQLESAVDWAGISFFFLGWSSLWSAVESSSLVDVCLSFVGMLDAVVRTLLLNSQAVDEVLRANLAHVADRSPAS